MDIPAMLTAAGTFVGVVSTAVVVVLRQTKVLATWERLRHERTAVRMTKEQRRMAETRLAPGFSLTHVTPDGGRLSIRSAAPTGIRPVQSDGRDGS